MVKNALAMKGRRKGKGKGKKGKGKGGKKANGAPAHEAAPGVVGNCRKCGKPGHWAAECRSGGKGKGGKTGKGAGKEKKNSYSFSIRALTH